MAGSRRRGWGAIRSRKVKGGVSYYASYRDPVDGSERVTAPHAFSSREDAEGWLAAERRLVECGTRIRRSIAPRSRSMTTPMEARRLGVSVRKNRSKTFSPCPSCIRMTHPGRGR